MREPVGGYFPEPPTLGWVSKDNVPRRFFAPKATSARLASHEPEEGSWFCVWGFFKSYYRIKGHLQDKFIINTFVLFIEKTSPPLPPPLFYNSPVSGVFHTHRNLFIPEKMLCIKFGV